MMCALTVPAIAMNTTDAECEDCFGTIPPEITEIQTHGLKEASSYSGEVEEVVIWEDDFNTYPFNGGWHLWYPIPGMIVRRLPCSPTHKRCTTASLKTRFMDIITQN